MNNLVICYNFYDREKRRQKRQEWNIESLPCSMFCQLRFHLTATPTVPQYLWPHATETSCRVFKTNLWHFINSGPESTDYLSVTDPKLSSHWLLTPWFPSCSYPNLILALPPPHYKLLPHPLPLSACRYILSPLPGTPDHCPITRLIWTTGYLLHKVWRTLQTRRAAAFSASAIACTSLSQRISRCAAINWCRAIFSLVDGSGSAVCRWIILTYCFTIAFHTEHQLSGTPSCFSHLRSSNEGHV